MKLDDCAKLAVARNHTQGSGLELPLSYNWTITSSQEEEQGNERKGR